MDLSSYRRRLGIVVVLWLSTLVWCLGAAGSSTKSQAVPPRQLEPHLAAMEEHIETLEREIRALKREFDALKRLVHTRLKELEDRLVLFELQRNPDSWTLVTSDNAGAELSSRGGMLIVSVRFSQGKEWVGMGTDIAEGGKVCDLRNLDTIEALVKWTGPAPITLEWKLEDKSRVVHGKAIVIRPKESFQRIVVRREDLRWFWNFSDPKDQPKELSYDAITRLDLGITRKKTGQANRGVLTIKSIKLLRNGTNSEDKQ